MTTPHTEPTQDAPGQAMTPEQLSDLMMYIQQFNSPRADRPKGRPQVRAVIPYYDTTTALITKIELCHGHKRSIKNFEVRYTKSGATLQSEIMEWLNSKLIPREVLNRRREGRMASVSAVLAGH